MNSDLEYLYLDVNFSDDCKTVIMKLGVFMYTEKLGLNGGQLRGEEGLTFLKNNVHGRQPELVNYFWMFGPDETYTLPFELIVQIPPIKDVKFKHNKFDRKRRAFKTSMMSIPCVTKIPKQITLKMLRDLLATGDVKLSIDRPILSIQEKAKVEAIRNYLEEQKNAPETTTNETIDEHFTTLNTYIFKISNAQSSSK